MALNNRDVQKILDTGFVIIREDLQRLAIKCKTKNQREWHTLDKGFTSKASLRRAMNVLLDESKTIED